MKWRVNSPKDCHELLTKGTRLTAGHNLLDTTQQMISVLLLKVYGSVKREKSSSCVFFFFFSLFSSGMKQNSSVLPSEQTFRPEDSKGRLKLKPVCFEYTLQQQLLLLTDMALSDLTRPDVGLSSGVGSSHNIDTLSNPTVQSVPLRCNLEI